MAKLLFISTCGSENPTKATLPLLLAKAAVEEGHEVKLVLVGDAAVNIRDAVIDAIRGVGLPTYRELFDFAVGKKVDVFV
jgi:predicted peroxiredoxin